MTIIRKQLVIGLIYASFFIAGCIPSKQTTEFRQMKKMADTLVVITPYIEITAFDFRAYKPDSLLAEQNREIITDVTNQVLSSKYALKQLEMPELDSDKLLALLNELDHSSAANSPNIQQTFSPSLNETANNKLAMFIIFHAEYNAVTTAVTINSMSNTWGFIPSARPRSDLRLIVFNTNTDEIIFYNRYDTRNYSASSPADMERMTRKILRDIYYK